MTNKEKKTYLSQYRLKQLEIKRLQDELEVWQSRAEKITATLSGMPGGGGTGGIENSAVKISDLKDEIQHEIDKAIMLRHEIESAIDSVQDDILRELLKLRYISGNTWEEIAEKMNFSSERWVRTLHGRALDIIKIEPVNAA